MDQLTFAEAAAGGAAKILVAIADVDAVIKKASAFDGHAQHNTTSIYTAAEILLGWLKNSPSSRFNQIRLPESEPPEWLDEVQITRLLATNDDPFRNIMLFLLHTGCRHNEALGITWDEVDLLRRKITIRGKVGKM